MCSSRPRSYRGLFTNIIDDKVGRKRSNEIIQLGKLRGSKDSGKGSGFEVNVRCPRKAEKVRYWNKYLSCLRCRPYSDISWV